MPKKASNSFIINVAACDWLTLTTYDKSSAAYVHSLVVDFLDGQPQGRGKVMQYVGYASEHTFIGSATQRGQDHWLARFTGKGAHEFLQFAHARLYDFKGWHCTRIDIQCTVPNPVGIDLPAIARQARQTNGSDWGGRGKRPQIPVYDDENDADTMYIGSRSSPRMQRIYRKYSDDKERFIRWETEFKEKLAPAVWQRYLIGGFPVLAQVLHSEITATPECISNEFADMLAFLEFGGERLAVTRDKPDYERTWSWVQDSLGSTFADLLQSPIREEVARWLIERVTNAVAIKLALAPETFEHDEAFQFVRMLR